MTTQYAIISSVSGQASLAAKLFAVNGDQVLYTADSVTERTNALGQYLCTFGELAVIPAGDYVLEVFTAGGLPVAIGSRTFAGTNGETATASSVAAVLDSASQASIAAIELWTKRNAVILSGLVSGAGTATEVFVISSLGITATVTADASGNRTALVWS